MALTQDQCQRSRSETITCLLPCLLCFHFCTHGICNNMSEAYAPDKYPKPNFSHCFGTKGISTYNPAAFQSENSIPHLQEFKTDVLYRQFLRRIVSMRSRWGMQTLHGINRIHSGHIQHVIPHLWEFKIEILYRQFLRRIVLMKSRWEVQTVH